MEPSKPAYKSTEFYLSLAAMLIGALLASGVFPDSSPWLKLLGAVSSILGALGYTASRTFVKATEAKAAALVEASSTSSSDPS